MTSPPYIFYGGASLPPPPYTCNGTQFVAHVFPGTVASQQAFIDGTLNAATSPGRFQALSPFVFLLAVACAEIGSAVPPFSEQGTAEETDIGFWIAVADTHQGGALRMQPAYMFVDNWLAMAGGREIWGFPKALGVTAVGGGSLWDGPIAVSSLAIPRFGPGATASLREVFRLLPPEGALAAILSSLEELDLLTGLERAMGVAAEGTGLLLDIVKGVISVGVLPMVLLKQFRRSDAEAGTVYSSAVFSGASITALRGFGVVSGGYQLSLADYDSQPIARDLGLVAGAQNSVVGVWADLDFTLDLSS